ncbi:MAG: hypothetical protein ABIR24_13710, partial [Verrucomicrobiota bacterium]
MKQTAPPALAEFTPPVAGTLSPRLPLRGWALELARRWNGGTYSLFILHGNIYDIFPVQEGAENAFVPLKTFLARRIFPERSFLLFYDIGDGLSFGSADMQKRFFSWLKVYDEVEGTSFHQQGPPRDFIKLALLLRRFFLRIADEKREGISLIIDFPEKIIPEGDSYSSQDERTALVTLLKWAASPEMRRLDVGIFLVTETAAKLSADLLLNPHVAQIKIELPDAEDRVRFLESSTIKALVEGKPLAEWSDFQSEDLANRLSGLNLLRIQHLLAEAVRNGSR